MKRKESGSERQICQRKQSAMNKTVNYYRREKQTRQQQQTVVSDFIPESCRLIHAANEKIGMLLAARRLSHVISSFLSLLRYPMENIPTTSSDVGNSSS